MNAINAEISWISRSNAGVPLDNRARIRALSVEKGSGSACEYCRTSIGPEAVEYRTEVLVLATLRTLTFHRACFHCWESMHTPADGRHAAT